MNTNDQQPRNPLDESQKQGRPVPGSAPAAAADTEREVSDTYRNGSIAGIAVVLGFSLNFTATWSQGPDPWTYRGIPVMAIAATGIVLQLSALFQVFTVSALTVKKHRTATAKFFWGVLAVLLAFAVHITLDIAGDLLNGVDR